jgi:hypothetical protein
MRKISLIVFLFLSASLNLYPQGGFNAGASFNLGIPLGNFADLAKTGIGGTVIGEYVFDKSFSLTLSVSYQNFESDFNQVAIGGSSYDVAINCIPVLLGARNYFSDNFFGVIETGGHFVKASAEVYDVYSEDQLSTSYEFKFGIGAGTGFRYNLSEQSVFELSWLFHYVENDFNYIVIHAGVIIFLDKI